jgi:uncharacterized protein (TIGR00661 family)
MKVIFVIQGEGRGHLTQALSLKHELEIREVKLQAVIVSQNSTRKLPDFFTQKIECPLIRLDSPNFIYDNKLKGINFPKTIYHNLKFIPKYAKSIRKLNDILYQLNPSLIINFFEPLVALSKIFSKNKYPVFSLAHQYIFEHPSYKFPKGFMLDRISIINYTKFTRIGSVRKYALSIYPLNNLPKKNLIVIPPILRRSITNLNPANENFILVYLLNQGYLDEVVQYKRQNSEMIIHVFTDKADLIEDREIENGLWLHQLNDVLFLEMMSKCRALLTTAGFESIAEAMYLQKPVIMVPIKGHFEQFCNSRDAANAGAGNYCESFTLNTANELIERYIPNKNFRKWYSDNNNILAEDILEYVSSENE